MMGHLLHALGRAIFTGNREWAWRRRGAISGGAMGLAGIATAIWWDTDIAHSSMVMTNSITLFLGSLTAYTGAVVVDDHLKRKVETTSGP
jgi:hypothetical protein